MSVWETIEHLQQYAYHTASHAELLRQQHAWFEKFAGATVSLWWVPAGHRPGVDEAKQRLAHLETHGSTPFAFTFRRSFPADEAFVRTVD